MGEFSSVLHSENIWKEKGIHIRMYSNQVTEVQVKIAYDLQQVDFSVEHA